MNVLTLVLAKMWECDDALVGFSTWYHGYTALACSIRYQRSSESCIVDVETGSADFGIFAKTEMNKRILGEAIRRALEGYQS